MKATRDAYGEALIELGKENKNVVALDADCSESTRTKQFCRVFPERFFNVGVSEQDLIGTAAGLASCNKISFASTFAIFTCRAWEQIRNTVAYDRLNVKIVATHAGLSDGVDGVSHHSIEDIALMRSIPNMSVFVPCDAAETKFIVKAAAANCGPAYIRLGRDKVPIIFSDDHRFGLTKAEVLRDGDDVGIIACGIMVHEALRAAELLKKEVNARVIDMHTIKPLDEALILKAASETCAIVTAEEHSIIGGLGGAVAEVLGERRPVPVSRVGMRDTFGESGDPSELMKKYGLKAEDIVQAVNNVIKSKR